MVLFILATLVGFIFVAPVSSNQMPPPQGQPAIQPSEPGQMQPYGPGQCMYGPMQPGGKNPNPPGGPMQPNGPGKYPYGPTPYGGQGPYQPSGPIQPNGPIQPGGPVLIR